MDLDDEFNQFVMDEIIDSSSSDDERCWGLDLRVKPPPSEMLPNSFVGPNEGKPNVPEGIG